MSADPARPTLRLRGEVDMLTANGIAAEGRRLLEQAHPGADLVVDLRDVTFLDSSGLSALVQLRRDVVANGGALVLSDVPDRIRALLQVSGLAGVFVTD